MRKFLIVIVQKNRSKSVWMCVGRVRGTKETRWNKFIFLPPKKCLSLIRKHTIILIFRTEFFQLLYLLSFLLPRRLLGVPNDHGHQNQLRNCKSQELINILKTFSRGKTAWALAWPKAAADWARCADLDPIAAIFSILSSFFSKSSSSVQKSSRYCGESGLRKNSWWHEQFYYIIIFMNRACPLE